MRRQARISAGGAFILRSASAVQVWLWLLIFVFQNEMTISGSIQPGYLDFDNLPETNFTCEGKVIGGYYADLETSCQMFHVCTVGQQDEPMDIKFLCLNGTVFDQETRVCERVDEVDCTKSERFYSLNLELYGSTLPPVSKPNQTKPQTEESHKNKEDEDSDPTLTDKPNKDNHRDENTYFESQDSTEDPSQEVKNDSPQGQLDNTTPTHSSGLSEHIEPIEENQEEEEIDSEDPEYDDEYSQSSPAFTTVPTTTTTRPPFTSTHFSSTPLHPASISPVSSSAKPTVSTTNISNSPETSIPTVDPALLSPQEFIYRHRGPGSEAISFQRQSFRPADGVYITHAPPSQFDHFQYESSRTAPRPGAPRPAPFVQRPVPTPFRATTLNPRDQMLRPGSSTQPSERYETSIKHRPPSYLPPLPAQRPLPFDPYFYDHKRSEDTHLENESSLAARSVAPPVIKERQPSKLKSPPRVIVTASASVSDSNGKRLNYTVGNVVSAVKPIVPINYDDYKESDLIFDPFFLDVPKLKKMRKTRGDLRTKPVLAVNVPSQLVASFKIGATPTKWTEKNKQSSIPPTSSSSTTSTAAWNPDDYVDDNYEPLSYVQPAPPITILLPKEKTKLQSEEKPSLYTTDSKHIVHDKKLKESKTSYSTQSSSSQSAVGALSSKTEVARLPRTDALPLHL